MATRRDPGKYVAVTPHDTNALTNGETRGISLAVGGDLKVTYADGDTETLTLPAGVHALTGALIIWSTGTTATGISAIY